MDDHLAQSPTTPAADLVEHIGQLIADLADVAQWQLPADGAEAEPVARIFDRLAEDSAEAAAMVRALPERPPEAAGHTFAALNAIVTAVEAEHDFAGWLAGVLTRAAAHYGSADHLVMGRSGSWEASLVVKLVTGTAGPFPGDLDRWKDGAS